jgi:hypothetical protein
MRNKKDRGLKIYKISYFMMMEEYEYHNLIDN